MNGRSYIKRPLSLAILLLVCGFCHCQNEVSLTSDNRLKNSIDSLVDQSTIPFFNEHRKQLSIAIYAKGKTYYYNYLLGTNNSTLPSCKTLYEIGSITKTFTGYLLAKASVDKKVKLDDDIRTYLDEDYPNLEFNGSPIRLFHLLNHSSGLPFDFIDRSPFENLDEDDKVLKLAPIENGYQPRQILKDLHSIKLDTTPGVNLKYSNAAAQLLGLILEKAYSLPYTELIENVITGPLNMKNTFFSVPENKMPLSTVGYSKSGKMMPHFNSGLAGGLYSSTEDLLKYGKTHLDESNEVIQLTHTPTWGQIQYYAMGLNWQMEQKEEKRVWQSGSTPGYTSLLAMYPQSDTVIVLLTNEHDDTSEGDLSKISVKLLTGIKAMVLEK
ncbi:MAG: serine hydrolase domain-containing protein [Allomuricauda sp.]